MIRSSWVDIRTPQCVVRAASLIRSITRCPDTRSSDAVRFVGEKQIRQTDERSGDRHSLLLSHRQLFGPFAGVVAELESRQQSQRPRLIAMAVCGRVGHDARYDILQGSKRAQQIVPLKDKSNAPAQRCYFEGAGASHVCVKQAYVSWFHPPHHAQKRQQRRFALTPRGQSAPQSPPPGWSAKYRAEQRAHAGHTGRTAHSRMRESPRMPSYPYIKAAGSMRCKRRLANQADKVAIRIVSPPTASTRAAVSSKSRRVAATQIS